MDGEVMEIGERIRKVREMRMITQEEAAAELGLHVRSVQDYEQGRAHPRQGARRRTILAWLSEHERTAA